MATCLAAGCCLGTLKGLQLGSSHLWSLALIDPWSVWSSISSDFSGSSARVSAAAEAGPLPAPNLVLSVLSR